MNRPIGANEMSGPKRTGKLVTSEPKPERGAYKKMKRNKPKKVSHRSYE